MRPFCFWGSYGGSLAGFEICGYLVAMKLLLGFSTIILSLSGLGQSAPKDTAADCIIHWRLGEKKTYSIVHEKSAVGESGNATPFRFVYEAQVSVIDSSSQGLTMQWQFQIPDDIKKTHPGIEELLPVYNGMKMIFKVAETGEFVTLVNWERVRDAYVRQMELSLRKDPDSTMLAGTNAAKKMFDSKEAVESSFIKEIQLFHALYGYRFTIRGSGARSSLPSPFGGEPLPTYQTYQLTKVDRTKDNYTIVADLTVDTANMQKIVDPLLKKMNVKGDAEMEEVKKQLRAYKMHDFTEYHLIMSSGWVSQIHHTRVISEATMSKSESFTIELKQ